jgi:SET domain-containing protein
MMLVRAYAAASAIEGLGVFAGEFIPKGTKLFFTREEYDALATHMQDFVDCYSYPHLERPGIRIVDCDHGKFMNHSERPNTDFTVFDSGYALADIQKGEEITCNYFEFDPTFTGFGHASTAEALSERPHASR